jgi:hypothetical protein
MLTETAITEIEGVLAVIEPTIPVSTQADDSDWAQGTDQELRALMVRAAAAIERWAPASTTYRNQLTDLMERGGGDGWIVVRLAGILEGLRDDYRAGFMRRIAELVRAEVFADFLEMSDELLSKKYKDAAAVITGGVLEQHLRELAARHNVAVEKDDGRPRRAEAINQDLVKAEVYDKLDQKGITHWLDLRNKAAHGEYATYDQDQVEAFVRDVRSFISRHPA